MGDCFLIIKYCLYAVVSNFSVFYQVQLALHCNGLFSRIFSILAVFVLIMTQNLIATSLPPLNYRSCGANLIGQSESLCLQTDLLSYVPSILAIFSIFSQLSSMLITVSVCICSFLEILNIDITGLLPLRRNRRYHFKVGIKNVDVALSADPWYRS